MSLLGLDIGVTRCTASIYARDGRLLARGVENNRVIFPLPGAMELAPEHVMTAVRHAVLQATEELDERDPVTALSFSTQGEAVIPVDHAGRALGPALLTFDNRPALDAEELAQRIGRERAYEISGLPLDATYSLPKIRWWQRAHPEIFQQTARFLCFGGLLLQRFGLAPVIDYSMGGRMLAMDLTTRGWSAELLAAVGLSAEMLPPLRQAGTPLGMIPEEIAEQYGLPPGVQVVLGGHDQACCALACGAIEPGMAMDAFGSVECLAPVLGAPVLNAVMAASGYGCYPHVVPERYLTLAYSFTGGSLLQWYRNTFGTAEDEEAHASGLHFHDILLREASNDPSPVLVLPHFTVVGTPWRDAAPYGAITGLTLTTAKAQIIKGLFDGMAYEMRVNLDRLSDAGVEVAAVRAIGGGAIQEQWLQLKADIFRRPVAGVDIADAATLGAALLAGMGTGIYRDAEDAVKRVVLVTQLAEPRIDEMAQYERTYRQYARLYPALKPLRDDAPTAPG